MTIAGPLEERPAATIAADTEIELFSVAGLDGHLREVNETFARLLGMNPADLDQRSILELAHPEDLGDIVAGLAALEAGSPEVAVENRFRRLDGSWIHLQWVARPLPGTTLWWAAGRETTEFHRLAAQRADLRARLDLTLGPSTAAMWELDARTGVLGWDEHAAHVLGLTTETLPIGVVDLAAALHPDDADAVTAAFSTLLVTGATDIAVRVHPEAGTRFLSLRGKVLDRDRRGRPLRVVGLLFDVTNEKAMEDQMLRMIMTDGLTGMPNRRAFDQALRGEWRRCTRAGGPLSVIMIDIDHFKKFNDTFGHLVGDEVLCAVARALTASLHREGDSVARFGGEEFAVVLPGIDGDGAVTVAERLVAAVRAVTIRQAPGWNLTVSAGSASWHPDAGPLKSVELLSRADEALYVAKAAGRDRAIAYENSLADKAALEDAIRAGLDAAEFELHYQPIIALRTGDIAGVEALIRWNRPGHGTVPPDAFIPVAETSTLICDLGRWVLREATAQLTSWLVEGAVGAGVRLAVNTSALHIASSDIVSDVRDALEASGLPAHHLEVELTETALGDDGMVGTNLARLRELGVTVSIDDFGTGHTSVGQLPNLPINTLKIDRSFLALTDRRQRDLVTLIIGAAHAFGLRVVAEGIEDPATLHWLKDLGCDDAQGFLMARPMPAAAIATWLAQWPAERGRFFAGGPVVERQLDQVN